MIICCTLDTANEVSCQILGSHANIILLSDQISSNLLMESNFYKCKEMIKREKKVPLRSSMTHFQYHYCQFSVLGDRQTDRQVF